ncbi:hypothetical protein KSF78_0001565 [Schistosoma japonicum]|nr:hypothetical protein KSF78_0001565 [Schistosoma japonicum]
MKHHSMKISKPVIDKLYFLSENFLLGNYTCLTINLIESNQINDNVCCFQHEWQKFHSNKYKRSNNIYDQFSQY